MNPGYTVPKKEVAAETVEEGAESEMAAESKWEEIDYVMIKNYYI